MDEITIKAHAKLNLTLQVLSKRPDGYHDLRTIMQSIALHDTLHIKKTEQPGIKLTCDNAWLPTDDNNLIIRVAEYLFKEYKIPLGLSAKLTKRIPVSAGLGGGSSNGAAALKVINTLFELNIPTNRLMEIGKAFGADIPFCLRQGTVLAEGIGEKITILPPHPPAWVLIATPDVYVSTAEIFKKYVPGRRTATPNGTGSAKPSLLRNGNGSEIYNINDITDALHQQDIHRIAAYFYNDLTSIATHMHPEIAFLIDTIKDLGAINAAMSGSGPTVFGYFDNQEALLAAKEVLPRIYKHLRGLYLTETYQPD